MDICTPSKASAPLRGCLSTGCSKKAPKSRPQHVGFSRCDAVEFKRDEPSTAMKRMNREDAEAMFKVEEKQVDQGERETQEITWGNTEALRQAEEGWEEDYNDETVERVVGRRASNIFKKGEFEAEEGDFEDEGDDTHSPLRWDNNSSNSDSGNSNSNDNDNEEQDNNYQPGMDMNMNGDADVDDINSSSSSYFNNIPQLLSSLSTATKKDTSTAISTGPLHRLLSLVPYHPVSDSVINSELERAASEISSNPPSSLHAFEHTCCLNILNNLTALRDSLVTSSLSSSPSSSPVDSFDKISDVEFLKIECSSLSSEIKLNESVLLSLQNASELMKVDLERSRWHLLRSILNYSIMILDDGIIVSLEQIRKYGGKGWRGKWTMIGEDECRLTDWGGDGDNFKCRDDEFEYSGTTVEVAETVKPLLEFLTNSSEWMVKGGILPTGVVAPSELSKVVETGSRYMSSVVDVVDTINWCDSVGTVEVGTYVKGTGRDGKEEEELQDGEPVRSRHDGGGENVEVDLYLDSPDGREKVRVKIEISVREVCEISRIWVEGDERTSVMLEEVVEEILGQT
ncbi:hypothetical protein TrST_g4817 [Triparma strigata]|nr:hypothetical protein TrST_g4817 [Triparma strigata]